MINSFALTSLLAISQKWVIVIVALIAVLSVAVIVVDVLLLVNGKKKKNKTTDVYSAASTYAPETLKETVATKEATAEEINEEVSEEVKEIAASENAEPEELITGSEPEAEEITEEPVAQETDEGSTKEIFTEDVAAEEPKEKEVDQEIGSEEEPVAEEISEDPAEQEDSQVAAEELPAEKAEVLAEAVEEFAGEESEEDEETVIVEDESGNVFKIRYNKSFTAKLSQCSDEAKKYYTVLKNELLSYKKAKSRTSWGFDSINAGRSALAKFVFRGKTLCMYIALAEQDLAGTKYKAEKTSSLKYESVPSLVRIKNPRRLAEAKALINLLADKKQLAKGATPSQDYSLPYQTTEELIAQGLIKEVKTTI